MFASFYYRKQFHYGRQSLGIRLYVRASQYANSFIDIYFPSLHQFVKLVGKNKGLKERSIKFSAYKTRAAGFFQKTGDCIKNSVRGTILESVSYEQNITHVSVVLDKRES